MARLSEDSYSDLLDLIYQTALAPETWEQVMRELADMTGCIAGGLTIENSETGRGYPITFFGFDPDHVAKTFDYFLPQNPLHAISDRMQPGSVVTNEMAISLDAFLETEFYNGWARPQGLCCPVTVVLDRTSTVYTPLTLVRPDGAGDVNGEGYDLLLRLAPHLMRALRTGVQFRNLEARSEMFASALSHLSAAVFVLDEQKRVGFANGAAEELMTWPTIVGTDRNRKLSATDRASNEALQAALRGVISGELAGADVRLQTQTGVPASATVLAVPASQASILPAEGQPACMVMIRDLEGDDHKAIARQAGLLFGLTPAEERLLTVLLNGAGLKNVAAQLGVGRETARTHLKSIFHKTGTHSQGELIGFTRRLMPSIAQEGKR